jgi:hypothetical protein
MISDDADDEITALLEKMANEKLSEITAPPRQSRN